MKFYARYYHDSNVWINFAQVVLRAVAETCRNMASLYYYYYCYLHYLSNCHIYLISLDKDGISSTCIARRFGITMRNIVL